MAVLQESPRRELAATPGPAREPAGEAGLTHDLSVPGGRPLCGADEVSQSPPDPVHRVTCPACARLVADGDRSDAHAQRPRADESED